MNSWQWFMENARSKQLVCAHKDKEAHLTRVCSNKQTCLSLWIAVKIRNGRVIRATIHRITFQHMFTCNEIAAIVSSIQVWRIIKVVFTPNRHISLSREKGFVTKIIKVFTSSEADVIGRYVLFTNTFNSPANGTSLCSWVAFWFFQE